MAGINIHEILTAVRTVLDNKEKELAEKKEYAMLLQLEGAREGVNFVEHTLAKAIEALENGNQTAAPEQQQRKKPPFRPKAKGEA